MGAIQRRKKNVKQFLNGAEDLDGSTSQARIDRDVATWSVLLDFNKRSRDSWTPWGSKHQRHDEDSLWCKPSSFIEKKRISYDYDEYQVQSLFQ